MKNYNVLVPVKDLDGMHQPGETVFLSDKDAAELITLGAVELIAPVGLTAEERQSAILSAISQLDPNNLDQWLKDGKPSLDAIAAITGWPIIAAERNAVWVPVAA